MTEGTSCCLGEHCWDLPLRGLTTVAEDQWPAMIWLREDPVVLESTVKTAVIGSDSGRGSVTCYGMTEGRSCCLGGHCQDCHYWVWQWQRISDCFFNAFFQLFPFLMNGFLLQWVTHRRDTWLKFLQLLLFTSLRFWLLHIVLKTIRCTFSASTSLRKQFCDMHNSLFLAGHGVFWQCWAVCAEMAVQPDLDLSEWVTFLSHCCKTLLLFCSFQLGRIFGSLFFICDKDLCVIFLSLYAGGVWIWGFVAVQYRRGCTDWALERPYTLVKKNSHQRCDFSIDQQIPTDS